MAGFCQRLRTGINRLVRNAPEYWNKGRAEYAKNVDRVRNFTQGAHRVAKSLAPEYGRQIDAVQGRANRILDKATDLNNRLQRTNLY